MYVPDEENYIVDGENYAPEIKEEEHKKKKRNRTPIRIVIVIIISLSLGFATYYISDLILNGKKEERPKEETRVTLSVDNEDVLAIYEKITYGRTSSHLNKYLESTSLTPEDFTNTEKFYYALSALEEEDLIDKGNGTYSISDEKMDELMKSYFGTEVTYNKGGTIPVVLQKTVKNGNTLSLTYDETNEEYLTTITETKEDALKEVPIFMASLDSAEQKGDVITLTEKVIYIDSTIENNQITYHVYKDFTKQEELDSAENVDLNIYNQDSITVKDYLRDARTITYRFKKENDNYVFVRSKIES